MEFENARTAFLHVGAPKTGTTFLQQVFWKNRELLGADGICYPLQYPFQHFHATLDLRRMPWAGRWDPGWEGTWDSVAESARSWQGPKAVLSNELLGGASETTVRRAVESLRPARVHVVLTARDLARQMPSGWQEHLKHRHAVSLDEFIEDLITKGSKGRYGRLFWSLHDWEAVLRRWSTVVPAERIHVVTLPPAGAPKGLLWERFAGLLGLDPDRYDTDVTRSNVSVGTAEAEVLRMFNAKIGDRLTGRRYGSEVRRRLVGNILATRPGSPRITLPREHAAWVRERSEKMVGSIRAAGYDVVGDLDDLVPAFPVRDQVGQDAENASPGAVLDVAIDAMVGLLQDAQPQGSAGRAMRERIEGLEEELAQRRRQPLKTVVRDFSRRYPVLMRARRAWWHAVERAGRSRSPRRPR